MVLTARVVCVIVAAASVLIVNLPGAWASPNGARAINNDCSAGTVAFTFDDGPGIHTMELVTKLEQLNLRATFFVIGEKIDQGEPAQRRTVENLAARGFSIQNHTYDHRSWTGSSTNTAPLSDAEIRQELEKTSTALAGLGIPRPRLYRPPFGDITAHADAVAREGGYRIVMPWSTPSGNIVSSLDWKGISASEIASNVIRGHEENGTRYPGIRNGSIVAMHDGDDETTPNTIESLQEIVDYMNKRHLCSTPTIRADATGGEVPYVPPSPPRDGGLLTQGLLGGLASIRQARMVRGN